MKISLSQPVTNSVDAADNLVDVVRLRADREPDRLAYRFLTWGAGAEPDAETVTCAEFDARVRAVAATLADAARPGDRVLLMCPPSLAYITHFFGCLYAGLVAVPAYPPGAGNNVNDARRIAAVACDAQPMVVVTGASEDAAALRARFTEGDGFGDGDGGLGRARWLTADEAVCDGREEHWRRPRITAETLAFLQYTSGSTGNPKGVMVSHGNVIANSRTAQKCFGFTPESVGGAWLPPFHDMGLIGAIIYPMYAGFPHTAMSPMSFLRDPSRWLSTISKYRVTVSPAPNFAYQMCVDRVPPAVREQLDLSSWVTALNGAEPVRADVLDRFVEAFGPCGFRRSAFIPCYGLAEGTLVVSGGRAAADPVVRCLDKRDLEEGRVRPPADAASMRPVVGCGEVAPGVEVVLVDPERAEPVAPDEVGEVWVGGAAVAGGYYRAQDATERTFGARLADGSGPYLRTGDLATMIDGELFIVGRAADRMVFRGRNVYPEDVEATCSTSHPGLASARTAVFSVDHDGEERLVVVQEMDRRHREEALRREVAVAVRRAVAEQHQLQVHSVVLVGPGKLPKTSSGKVQRRACRAQYLDGTLPALLTVTAEDHRVLPAPAPATAGRHDAAPHRLVAQRSAPDPTPAAPPPSSPSCAADTVAARMAAVVARLVGCAPAEVDVARPFAAYGLDSAQAVVLAAELSDVLGTEVEATLVWDHPTIAAAAAALARRGAAPTAPVPVPAQPAAADRPRGPGAAKAAVVGIGCRFPGADSPARFWQLLRSGGSAITGVPGDRWDADALFDPDPDAPGRLYARHGGFIGGVRGFDAGLFGITPEEAARMDPQHRLVLEVAWEALEHAGIAPDSLRGRRVGVFIGMAGSDYERLNLLSGGAAALDPYAATGCAANFAANRLSYTLGLRGPSIVVDTACSSSLVAVHLACQALRSGECDLALAGGVNLMLVPETSMALAKGRMLSPTGACRTFDAAADGYVRGEGCGIVVLRPAADAEAAGDRVLAVIGGSAVGQDGRSNGLTAPSGTAQEEVVRRALDAAGVAAAEVGYVEAHGTGTPLGDPVEVRALARVMSAGRPAGQAALLGSVKANIGHLETAAGIAGLIKAVLAVHYGEVPPHPGLSTPTPHLPWDELPLRVPVTAEPWPRSAPQARRVAGVSSFGFGGTNAHVVVESVAPTGDRPTDRAAEADTGPRPVLVKVAARGEAALRQAAARLAEAVPTRTGKPAAVAYTAGVGRADLDDRAAVVAASPQELVTGLTAVAAGRSAAGVVTGRRQPGPAPAAAFVVPGHGVRAAGMLRGLYGRVDPVTEAVDRMAAVLGGLDGPPLAPLLHDGPEAAAALERTEIAQPALYTAAVALAAWWRSVGVEPRVVVGHSLGAYAAAALAGLCSVEDGAELVAERGRVMARLSEPGAMAAVLCGEDELADVGPVAAGDVVVAVVNGPRDLVLSGPTAALDAALAELTARQVRSVRLPVAVAFHSALVEPALAGLEAAVRQVAWTAPQRPFVSDLTGRQIDAGPPDAEYWVRHTRGRVRFDQALRTMLSTGVRLVVELGPGGLLPAVLRAAGPEQAARLTSVASVPRTGTGDAAHRHLLQAAARVWVAGADLDWAAVNGPRPRRPAELPTYPFQHTEFWLPNARRTPPGETTPRPAAAPAVVPANPTAVDPPPAPADVRGAARRQDDLIRFLRGELAVLLELPGPDDIDPDTGLFDLGLTSAMVVQLRERVVHRLGIDADAVAPTTVFDHPTVRRLAGFLATVDGAVPGRPRRPAVPAARRHAPAAEPLAIVGMGCRFPGGANDLASYWRLLRVGWDGTGPVPAARWSAPGGGEAAACARRGGFLDVPVDGFDADAFGISPREARSMDPQQRLLLEVVWEALEHGGLTDRDVEGATTGVYVGINTSDHLQLLSAQGGGDLGPYLATGNTFSVAAGRLSYLLGASGPSLAVDTACSSSLVALHLACRSLRSGETDLALVAGVNLMLSPATTLSLARLGALSKDGRCRTFDEAATGYGRGEGCGAVVLRRLSDALAAGDRIWAVVRGTAVNQDGRSAGLTVPNGLAQRAVIEEALRDADVDPADIGYVEAHGTGTPLGDPLEIEALASVFAPGRDPARPLRIGSVKTNVGHLEAAAGVCGLIKTALTLHHGCIPPHLHLTRPNSRVPWERLPVEIPTRLTPWTAEGERLAGVSSFGFSGTNAHVVVGASPVAQPPGTTPAHPGGRPHYTLSNDAPAVGQSPDDACGQTLWKTADGPCPVAADDTAPENAEPAPRLLVLSARTPEALRASAAEHAAVLRGDRPRAGRGPAPDWPLTAAATALRRRHLPLRLAVVAHDADEAARLLAVAAAGGTVPGVVDPRSVPHRVERVVFAFSGQGNQWPGMARHLLDDPVAGPVFDRCEDVVAELAGWSLRAELAAGRGASRLDDTAVAQVAVFALQAALTELWREWGVVPDAVVGHSVGEVAAAHAAGALSLEQAAEVVVRRGRIMAATRGRGAMAVVGLPSAVVEELLSHQAMAGHHDALWVAAVNSPRLTVVAGTAGAVAALEPLVRGRRALWAWLQREYAFHSPLMRSVHADLCEALAATTPTTPRLPVFSALTGEEAGPDAFGARYWADAMVGPVRFADALAAAAGGAPTAVVEIGPHSSLGTAATEVLLDAAPRSCVTASLRAGRDSRATLLEAAGVLHVAGVPLDHAAVHGCGADAAGLRAATGAVELPTYPWQRTRHWLPARPSLGDGAATPTTGPAAAVSTPADPLTGLTYRVAWEPAPAPRPYAAGSIRPAEPPTADRPWLLLADRGGVGERLAARLEAVGHSCLLLRADPATDPDPRTLRAALAEALAGRSPRGLVSLWSLDAEPGVRAPGPALDRALALSCAPVLAVPHVFDGAPGEAPAAWVVTRGGVGVSDSAVEPSHAPVWGLGRVLALEHPEIRGGLLDLDPAAGGGNAAPDADAALIAAEILGSDGEDQVAYRAGTRHVARIRRCGAPPAASAAPLDPEGAYLVTGGRGTLGLRVAEHLAARGARHLVLLGRSPVPAAPADASPGHPAAVVARLEAAGVRVHLPNADVADSEAMAALLGPGAPWPSVRGVVHAAGRFEPCALRDLGWDALRDVLRPKVEGTLVLDRVLADTELDFFTAFSSASSVWGAAFAAHYAAANHFEDAMAHDRVRRGLPGLAVNWGWWADSTMAAGHGEYFAAMGLTVLPEEAALGALDRLPFGDEPQVIVAPVDWGRFRPVMEARRRRPLLEAMAATSSAATHDESLLRQLRTATPQAARSALEDAVQAEVAAVLGRDPGSRLDPELGFFEAGMDSITSVELRNRLRDRTGLPLPATLVFEHPTIAELTGHLLNEVAERRDEPVAAGPRPAPAATVPALDGPVSAGVEAGDLDDLSEDELLRLLDDEVEQKVTRDRD